MPTYTIEMLWTCSTCRADNRGLAKHCQGCGKPKTDKDPERFPDDISEANALAGDDAKAALAGPDWKCQFCGSLQTSTGRCCTECGADKETGEKPWEAKVHTVTENLETGAKHEDVTTEHVSTAKERAAQPAQPETLTKRELRTVQPPTPWGPGVLFIAVLLFVAFGLWLLFRTKIVPARVNAVSWEHAVIIDRYVVFSREGWTPDSDAFDVENRGERVHHYDRVRTGSHQVPSVESYHCGQSCTTVRGTCTTTPRTCRSNKNGTATCSGGDRICSADRQVCTPRLCTRPVMKTVDDYEMQARYQTWYGWHAWDWTYNRTVKHVGVTLETHWPSDEDLAPPSALAAGERERSHRVARYEVSFLGDNGQTYTIAPTSLELFQTYPIGRAVRLRVGVANGVDVLPEGS